MNYYLLSKFLISFTGVPICLYLMYTGLMNYKKSRARYSLYFVSSFAFLALGMFIYSLTPFLKEGQDLFAEITLGGSFILLMLVSPIYTEFFHGIYQRVPYISKIFYYAAGGGIVSLFFKPWEILYVNDLYGYSQSLSDIIIICVLIQLVCIYIIMFKAFRVIKAKVDRESEDVKQVLKESTDNQELILLMKDRKDNLKGKQRVLNIIILSYFVGICLIGIGFIIPVSFLDSVGLLVVVAPQAYFFSRDNEILVYLSAQKIREETKNLQKGLHILNQQSTVFPQIVQTEIQSMVNFIEKADLILPHRNK